MVDSRSSRRSRRRRIGGRRLEQQPQPPVYGDDQPSGRTRGCAEPIAVREQRIDREHGLGSLHSTASRPRRRVTGHHLVRVIGAGKSRPGATHRSDRPDDPTLRCNAFRLVRTGLRIGKRLCVRRPGRGTPRLTRPSRAASERSATTTSPSHSQRSRGICWLGGSPRSARWRYHSAQPVSTSSARYSASTTWPRCQRLSGGGSRRGRAGEPAYACLNQRPVTGTASTSSAKRHTAPGSSSSETTRATLR
jgi:hypothetical protein